MDRPPIKIGWIIPFTVIGIAVGFAGFFICEQYYEDYKWSMDDGAEVAFRKACWILGTSTAGAVIGACIEAAVTGRRNPIQMASRPNPAQ